MHPAAAPGHELAEKVRHEVDTPTEDYDDAVRKLRRLRTALREYDRQTDPDWPPLGDGNT